MVDYHKSPVISGLPNNIKLNLPTIKCRMNSRKPLIFFDEDFINWPIEYLKNCKLFLNWHIQIRSEFMLVNLWKVKYKLYDIEMFHNLVSLNSPLFALLLHCLLNYYFWSYFFDILYRYSLIHLFLFDILLVVINAITWRLSFCMVIFK